MTFEKIILGSRSPRRKELLSQIIPEASIEIIPPLNSEEAGFDRLCDLDAIQQRLISICTTKNNDVFQQVNQGGTVTGLILTADTIVVIQRQDSSYLVLGQPPAGPEWKQTVRDWFLEDFAGKTHRVITGLCVREAGQLRTEISQTFVTFHDRDYVHRHLEWYLSLEESVGKAGGYAVQGAGSIFVSRIEGSLSNVVGLPLENILRLLN
ncbi:Maf family protein [uncultured Gimesia sp.]|uniref:Maf family protein n=1 Tax=uncultured Gimesia sp. TaxID=1678688 RepID=UPI0030DAC463|tara:strand:- start:22108 stop:22734 length:627 start_codon:yes stop_codon:yes gene_type:complete